MLHVGNLHCSWCFTFYQLPNLIEHKILLTFHSKHPHIMISSKFPTFYANQNQCLPIEPQQILLSPISLLVSHLAIYCLSRVHSCLLKEWNKAKLLSCLKPSTMLLYHWKSQISKSLSPVIMNLIFGLLVGSWFSLCFQWSIFNPCCSLTFCVYSGLEVSSQPVPWSHPLFRASGLLTLFTGSTVSRHSNLSLNMTSLGSHSWPSSLR